MSWDQITSWLSELTDKPIFITLAGILTVVGAVFVFLSKTSFGKKAIAKLTKLYYLGDKIATETLKKVQDVETLAKERIDELEGCFEQKVTKLKNEYEQKVAALISIANFYEETLFITLEKIPNAKVQEQVAILKEEYQNKKKEIEEIVGVIYQDYTLALKNKEEEIRREYDEKVNYLENQIAQITLYLNEIKKEEPSDGEGEEGENPNPTEEEIQSD